MGHNVDAVVIGAGVVGSSIALELTRSGREVLVLDKAGGLGHGSTSASSGVVRFNYSTLAGVLTSWESVHAWRDWAGHLGYTDPAGLAAFCQTGMLVLDRVPGASERTTELFDRVGVPWERWSAEEIARRLPAIDVGRFGPPAPVDSDAFFADADGVLGGIYTPDAGHVQDPQLAAQNLGVAAQHLGASYLLRQEVRSIEATGPCRWLVHTTSGTAVSADIVINAAGPWASRINAIAGVGAEFNVTSRPLRQEVHHVPAPTGFDRADGTPGISLADPDLGIYARTAGSHQMLVGGMEPECDPLEWVADPDTVDPQPTLAVFEAQVMRASRRFPGLGVPNRPLGLTGVYDASTDWAPIYDRTAQPGFYVAMGTSGNQFKNAPVVGHLMRNLIEQVENEHDHDRDPVQVKLPRTGSLVDMAAYSRLRPVNPDAPMSVLG